eukprot:jgi/Ulvmu1/12281/UM087_0015.1
MSSVSQLRRQYEQNCLKNGGSIGKSPSAGPTHACSDTTVHKASQRDECHLEVASSNTGTEISNVDGRNRRLEVEGPDYVADSDPAARKCASNSDSFASETVIGEMGLTDVEVAPEAVHEVKARSNSIPSVPGAAQGNVSVGRYDSVPEDSPLAPSVCDGPELPEPDGAGVAQAKAIHLHQADEALHGRCEKGGCQTSVVIHDSTFTQAHPGQLSPADAIAAGVAAQVPVTIPAAEEGGDGEGPANPFRTPLQSGVVEPICSADADNQSTLPSAQPDRPALGESCFPRPSTRVRFCRKPASCASNPCSEGSLLLDRERMPDQLHTVTKFGNTVAASQRRQADAPVKRFNCTMDSVDVPLMQAAMQGNNPATQKSAGTSIKTFIGGPRHARLIADLTSLQVRALIMCLYAHGADKCGELYEQMEKDGVMPQFVEHSKDLLVQEIQQKLVVDPAEPRCSDTDASYVDNEATLRCPPEAPFSSSPPPNKNQGAMAGAPGSSKQAVARAAEASKCDGFGPSGPRSRHAACHLPQPVGQSKRRRQPNAPPSSMHGPVTRSTALRLGGVVTRSGTRPHQAGVILTASQSRIVKKVRPTLSHDGIRNSKRRFLQDSIADTLNVATLCIQRSDRNAKPEDVDAGFDTVSNASASLNTSGIDIQPQQYGCSTDMAALRVSTSLQDTMFEKLEQLQESDERCMRCAFAQRRLAKRREAKQALKELVRCAMKLMATHAAYMSGWLDNGVLPAAVICPDGPFQGFLAVHSVIPAMAKGQLENLPNLTQLSKQVCEQAYKHAGRIAAIFGGPGAWLASELDMQPPDNFLESLCVLLFTWLDRGFTIAGHDIFNNMIQDTEAEDFVCAYLTTTVIQVSANLIGFTEIDRTGNGSWEKRFAKDAEIVHKFLETYDSKSRPILPLVSRNAKLQTPAPLEGLLPDWTQE